MKKIWVLLLVFILINFFDKKLGFTQDFLADSLDWNKAISITLYQEAQPIYQKYKGDFNPANSPIINSQVNLATGNYSYQYKDVFIPSRSLNLELNRFYNNQDDYNSPLGIGWNHNYNIFLVETFDGRNHIVLLRKPNGNKELYLKTSLTSFTAQAGVFSVLTKTKKGYNLKTKEGLIYNFISYDQVAYLESIIDKNSNKLSFSYDESLKLLTKVSDDLGRFIKFSYDTSRHITAITDHLGRTWQYSYKNDQLEAVNTPVTLEYNQGIKITYRYNDQGNLKAIIDARSNEYLNLNYDDSSRVVSVIQGGFSSQSYKFKYEKNLTRVYDGNNQQTDYFLNEDGSIKRKIEYSAWQEYETQYEYNQQKLLSKIVYPNKQTILYKYDDNGNILEINQISATDSQEIKKNQQATYDLKTNLLMTSIDAKGKNTSYEYDNYGNLTKIYQDGIIKDSFTYNRYGQVITSTNAKGVVTFQEYDNKTGYLIKIIEDYSSGGLNKITQFKYDNFGQVISIIDSRGNSQELIYNCLGQVLKQSQGLDNDGLWLKETLFSYDQNGNLIREENKIDKQAKQWQIKEYNYDVSNRLINSKDKLSDIEVFYNQIYYDRLGNKSRVIDKEGNCLSYDYDERNLLKRVTDPLGNTKEYTYDEAGNLIQEKDANGNITCYEYDGFSRLIRKVLADSNCQQYNYDQANNLIGEILVNGQKISFNYDVNNKLSEKIYSNGQSSRYKYDSLGNLSQLQDNSEIINYYYDNLNRLVRVESSQEVNIKYEYDLLGNCTKIIYPDKSSINYKYDKLNRITEVTDKDGQVLARYSYDCLSRLESSFYANHNNTVYVWDKVSRLIKIQETNAKTRREKFLEYSYDRVGNCLSMINNFGMTRYSYNGNYQLVKIEYPQGVKDFTTTLEYDNAGNIVSLKEMPLSMIPESATFTELITPDGLANYQQNQIKEIQYQVNNLNQYTCIGDKILDYDSNSNLSNDGISNFSYNDNNQLVKIVRGALTINYSYDGLGRRIKKEVNDSGHTRSYLYFYDQERIIAEYDSNKGVYKNYIYGVDKLRPIVLEYKGNKFYYSYDREGSVISISDNQGQDIENYEYDLFGQVKIKDKQKADLDKSSLGDQYLFKGYWYDFDARLYHKSKGQYFPGLGIIC